MGKLLCDSSAAAIAEVYQPSPPPPTLLWRELEHIESTDLDDDLKTTWEGVSGLEDQQRRYLERLDTKGVIWKHPNEGSSMVFRLSHGEDVEADGNCLFTASKKAMGLEIDARELRRRTVKRFLEDLELVHEEERGSIDSSIKHLYSPDLKVGWGIHVVQEVKLLAMKADRDGLDGAINELVDLGMQSIPSLQTQKESSLKCLKCSKNENKDESEAVDDLKLKDSKDSGDTHEAESWTDAETLLLLESVLKHGDNWNLVAQNVQTKKIFDCISKLI